MSCIVLSNFISAIPAVDSIIKKLFANSFSLILKSATSSSVQSFGTLEPFIKVAMRSIHKSSPTVSSFIFLYHSDNLKQAQIFFSSYAFANH